MARLAKCLHYYIHDRLNGDPDWRGIEVILSDANCPGEGEHKIMDFIRRQRSNPDHDSNTRHCLCGADGDLIMLGLITHEPNFTVIREKFDKLPKPCQLCGQFGHKMKDCIGVAEEEQFQEMDPSRTNVQFIFIQLNVLREYLAKEFTLDGLPFAFDLEHIIDDWVFMCFFLGNDFIPHLPSVEPGEGGFDRILQVYKKAVYKTKGFVIENGEIELSRLQLIMTDLAEKEEEIFREHQTGKRKREEDNDDSDEEPEPEDVRLWEDGWKDRYYKAKFNAHRDDHESRYKVAAKYVEGLSWVLKYYHQGCPSWNWYFPYRYAPFASDFINIGHLNLNFEKGKPLKPLEQLMAVIPAESKQNVPEAWGELMCDPKSPIVGFYPTDFETVDSEKASRRGVALLPFVDENKLLECLENVYHKLTVDEIKRNVQGNDRLYVREGHKGYDFLVALYKGAKDSNLEINMDPQLFSGMRGTVILSEDVIHPKETVPSPLHSLPDLPGNATVCISYVDPQYPVNYKFPAARLESAVDPPKVLKPSDKPIRHYRN